MVGSVVRAPHGEPRRQPLLLSSTVSPAALAVMSGCGFALAPGFEAFGDAENSSQNNFRVAGRFVRSRRLAHRNRRTWYRKVAPGGRHRLLGQEAHSGLQVGT